jgi:hypothetical protein
MNRNTIAAKKIRADLLEKLGAFCVDCGEDDEEKLEFDHIHGRHYEPRKLSYRQRMIRYRREVERGELAVVCGDCNLKRRKTNDNGQHVPTICDVPLTADIPF